MLAPLIIRDIFEIIRSLRATGLTWEHRLRSGKAQHPIYHARRRSL
jgi:hypothetical protein